MTGSSFVQTQTLEALNYQNSNEIVGSVILGGDTIGLQIQSVVQVIGKYEVTKDGVKQCPWNKTNIEKGDILYSIDGHKITSGNDITTIISNLQQEEVSLRLIRNNQYVDTKIKIYENDLGKKSIGLYIKDKISGVGTLTFINPNTQKYGALGHGVTGAMNGGTLYSSSVQGIRKGSSGVPGEKYATLSTTKIGSIEKNNDIGIFGTMNVDTDHSLIDILSSKKVHKGNAKIATVLHGNEIQYFDIEIVDVKSQESKDIKGLKIKVTDSDLIQETGGIIQGMSGSPVIQDGYLVGAVSHVTVEDPLCGFAVFAEWMFYETEN